MDPVKAAAFDHSARLLLRKPAPGDTASLFRIYGDPRTNAFNPAGPLREPKDAEALMQRWQDHWQEQGFGLWAMESKQSPGSVIGFGGLSYARIADQWRIHVGYRFAVEAWGRGYATEIAKHSVEFGFNQLALDEILAFVRPDHLASRQVLEKSGLIVCGTLDDVPGAAPSVLYTIKKPGH